MESFNETANSNGLLSGGIYLCWIASVGVTVCGELEGDDVGECRVSRGRRRSSVCRVREGGVVR